MQLSRVPVMRPLFLCCPETRASRYVHFTMPQLKFRNEKTKLQHILTSNALNGGWLPFEVGELLFISN